MQTEGTEDTDVMEGTEDTDVTSVQRRVRRILTEGTFTLFINILFTLYGSR